MANRKRQNQPKGFFGVDSCKAIKHLKSDDERLLPGLPRPVLNRDLYVCQIKLQYDH